MSNVITLLTDFGTRDSYVAQMKGVMLARASTVLTFVDISHEVPPQGIAYGARVLAEASVRFPPRTVHLAVVDPGVGTSRRIVAAKINDQVFVAPDNGLLGQLADEFPVQEAFELRNSQLWETNVSATFHGRDILAPVAVFLAEGGELRSVGPPVVQLERLPVWESQIFATNDGGVVARVRIDHFGNILTEGDSTCLGRLAHSTSLLIDLGSRAVEARIVSTYGQMPAGSLVALLGSQGKLEIAVVNGNAASSLNIAEGDELRFRYQ